MTTTGGEKSGLLVEPPLGNSVPETKVGRDINGRGCIPRFVLIASPSQGVAVYACLAGYHRIPLGTYGIYD